MTNKNKQEIEKIEKEVEQKRIDRLKLREFGKEGQTLDRYNLEKLDEEILKATLKTSIAWCEDEIEKLTPYVDFMDVSNEDSENTGEIKCKLIAEGYEYLEQLKSHLKWLKEKQEISQNENNNN